MPLDGISSETGQHYVSKRLELVSSKSIDEFARQLSPGTDIFARFERSKGEDGYIIFKGCFSAYQGKDEIKHEELYAISHPFCPIDIDLLNEHISADVALFEIQYGLNVIKTNPCKPNDIRIN